MHSGLYFVLVCLISLTALCTRAHSFDVMEATIAETHKALREGRTSCRLIVQQYLDRIAAYDKVGPALNAVQHVNARALTEAEDLDAARLSGQPLGRLHCIPVLLKDQIETSDMPTSYGSALFKDFVPKRNATVVLRLKAAGAIIIAKSTMGEFASRYFGSAAGIIRNAYDPTRNPSGSSSGSASGLAANFAIVGIGSDTGGSIRGPAAVSNLVGLRPTHSLVSRHGMMPYNPTQDVIGPITRCISDAAQTLDVIAGYDPADPITSESVGHVPASFAAGLSTDALRGARVGILRVNRASASKESAKEFAKVRVVLEKAIGDLRALGAEVIDSLTIPTLRDNVIPNNFESEQAIDDYLAAHPNAPIKTLKEILLAGTVNPSRARRLMDMVGKRTTDYPYLKVMRQRTALRIAVLKAMADAKLDAIVYTTYDAPPTPIATDVLTNAQAVDKYGLGDENRGLSPMIGLPALTVPAGFSSDGLPVGLEFLGRPFTEAVLLGYGFAFEQATRHRRPPANTGGVSSLSGSAAGWCVNR